MYTWFLLTISSILFSLGYPKMSPEMWPVETRSRSYVRGNRPSKLVIFVAKRAGLVNNISPKPPDTFAGICVFIIH